MSTRTGSRFDRHTQSQLLDSCLRERLVNRIPNVTVASRKGQLVVCGRVNTYYALQLTLAAVNNILQEMNGHLPREVAVAIRVGDAASDFHTVCRKHGDGELFGTDHAHGYANVNT